MIDENCIHLLCRFLYSLMSIIVIIYKAKSSYWQEISYILIAFLVTWQQSSTVRGFVSFYVVLHMLYRC